MSFLGPKIRLATQNEMVSSGEGVFVPSHIIEGAGAMSLGLVPIALLRLGTDLKVRDSIHVQNYMDTVFTERFRQGGAPFYATLVDRESKLNQLMPKAGHIHCGAVELYFKSLCQ